MARRYNIRTKFGLRCKELRAEAGVSQDTFAYSIGMSRTYFAEVETGKRNISLDNIERIANGFNVTLSDFFKSPTFGYAVVDLNKDDLAD